VDFRPAAVLALAGTALLGGCGHGGESPASIVRAWSKALNSGDNQQAAQLFANGARVIQAGHVLLLRTRADAVAFNAGLPCSGKILSVSTRGNAATATFLLGNRPRSRCDAPGQHARALFEVRGGKIVVWHQLPTGSRPALPGQSV
jgi:limonene-1,2-epoxide hydrolase